MVFLPNTTLTDPNPTTHSFYQKCCHFFPAQLIFTLPILVLWGKKGEIRLQWDLNPLDKLKHAEGYPVLSFLN